jgi:hypothetical protein
MTGANTSLLETSQITNIERDGFWLLTRAGEYFVSFADYPDFVGATLEKIFNFQENNGDFYWKPSSTLNAFR